MICVVEDIEDVAYCLVFQHYYSEVGVQLQKEF
jgi:hypothetical protein